MDELAILDESKALADEIVEMYDSKGVSPKVGAIAACYVACIAAVRAGSGKDNFLRLSASLFDLAGAMKKEIFEELRRLKIQKPIDRPADQKN